MRVFEKETISANNRRRKEEIILFEMEDHISSNTNTRLYRVTLENFLNLRNSRTVKYSVQLLWGNKREIEVKARTVTLAFSF